MGLFRLLVVEPAIFLVVFLFGDNGERRVPIKLSPHVFDDICLVFKLER